MPAYTQNALQLQGHAYLPLLPPLSPRWWTTLLISFCRQYFADDWPLHFIRSCCFDTEFSFIDILSIPLLPRCYFDMWALGYLSALRLLAALLYTALIFITTTWWHWWIFAWCLIICFAYCFHYTLPAYFTAMFHSTSMISFWWRLLRYDGHASPSSPAKALSSRHACLSVSHASFSPANEDVMPIPNFIILFLTYCAIRLSIISAINSHRWSLHWSSMPRFPLRCFDAAHTAFMENTLHIDSWPIPTIHFYYLSLHRFLRGWHLFSIFISGSFHILS